MSARRTIEAVGRVVAWVGLAGCAASMHGSGAQSAVAPPELAAGQSYFLYAPPGWTCRITGAAAHLGASQAVSVEGQYATPEKITIVDSSVEGTDVVARVRRTAGSELVLRIPSGTDSGCLFRDPEPLRQAVSRVGQRYVFTPWRGVCAEIQAQGPGAQSMLVETERGRVLDVSGIRSGPRTATELANGSGGSDIWLSLANGTLHVRGDVLAGCFTPEAEFAALPPATALDLLRTPPGRCRGSQDPKHIVCESTVGTWMGAVTANTVELTYVRRTMGPVHFHDGHPVSGEAYATTIVAVEQAAATGDRESRVQSALASSIRGAGVGGGSVRLTEPSDPKVTHTVRVETTGVDISELRKSTSSESSSYKVRDDVVPNPDKPAAFRRIEDARQRLSDSQQEVTRAQQDYEQSVRLFEEGKAQALEQCRNAAANAPEGSPERTMADGACNIADIASQFAEPGRDGIMQAESEVQRAESDIRTAESEHQSMPDTIIEPVMGTWSYTKTTYSRTARVTLGVALRRKDGAVLSNASVPVIFDWATYEVAADPAHNVQGQTPDRGPMDRPDALLDGLAQRASQTVAARVKAAIQSAEIEEAQRAFVAAGNPAPKPGYEAVDAIAFQSVGGRLDRLAQRGPAQVTNGQPFELPTGAEGLAPGHCLLVVAVAPPEAGAGVMLETVHQSHRDVRNGASASIEICQEEVGNQVPPVRIVAGAAVEVRWGIYHTRGG